MTEVRWIRVAIATVIMIALFAAVSYFQIKNNPVNDVGVRQRFLHLRDISPQSHLWQVFDNQLLKVCTTKLNPYYEFSTVIS